MKSTPNSNDAVFEAVKANMQLLRDCARPHVFKPVDNRKFPRKFRCDKCGGEVDVCRRVAYEEGMDDARKEAGR